MALLRKFDMPVYTDRNQEQAPPLEVITNMAAVLAAGTQSEVPHYEAELDDRLVPKHMPYGQAGLISIHAENEKVQVLWIDTWNVWRAMDRQHLHMSSGRLHLEILRRPLLTYLDLSTYVSQTLLMEPTDTRMLDTVIFRLCQRVPGLYPGLRRHIPLPKHRATTHARTSFKSTPRNGPYRCRGGLSLRSRCDGNVC